MKIKVIFTGGTISSEVVNGTVNVSNSISSQKQLINNFYKETACTQVEFDVSQPLSILSENMNISDWNILLNELRKIDFSNYDGIIIAHGTDTLAYTANMLSIMLAGIKIPVVLVASNYVLTDIKSNGNENFINAVYFICEKKYSGVYVVYSNEENESIVYLGSRIKQCENLTNKFSSAKGIDFGAMKDKKFVPIINKNNPSIEDIKNIESDNLLINKIEQINPCVLLVSPYTGLDYDCFNLSHNIKVVLHTLYHAGTACVVNDESTNNSIIDFYNFCRENDVDFYIAPLESGFLDRYSTTNRMLEAGIKALYDLSIEMAYVKLLIAYSSNDKILSDFIINNNIFFE